MDADERLVSFIAKRINPPWSCVHMASGSRNRCVRFTEDDHRNAVPTEEWAWASLFISGLLSQISHGTDLQLRPTPFKSQYSMIWTSSRTHTGKKGQRKSLCNAELNVHTFCFIRYTKGKCKVLFQHANFEHRDSKPRANRFVVSSREEQKLNVFIKHGSPFCCSWHKPVFQWHCW